MDPESEELARLRDENRRLHELVDHTADGAVANWCDHLFCPRCAGEIEEEDIDPVFGTCQCWNCENEDAMNSIPKPWSIGRCYSTKESAEAAIKAEAVTR